MKESTAEAKSAEGVLAKDAEGARGRGGDFCHQAEDRTDRKIPVP